MNEDSQPILNSKIVTEQLVQAIKTDEQIASTDSLSFQALKDNLPGVCDSIIRAIATDSPQLVENSEKNQGLKHGYSRSAQDFEPEEMVREFFLLKQIIIAELKPYLSRQTPEIILSKLTLIDLIINQVLENSFQSYATLRKQQVEKLNQQIFLTNQEITRLIADRQENLSYLIHEIKNPLTSIIGYSDLFLRQQRKYNADASSNNLEHIQQVLQQGRNVLRLINDTVEIDSYQKGKFKLTIGEVDVCILLEDVVLSLKPSIEAKELALVTSCIPDRLVIHSDYLRLQQIITNLLTNAIRYTNTGTIELTCRQIEPNYLEIKVKDTGIGISQDDRDRIFEPYFRTLQSQKSIPEGIGLGLAVVFQLVTMLQGTIELRSQVDRGSTFIVIIPLEPTSAIE